MTNVNFLNFTARLSEFLARHPDSRNEHAFDELAMALFSLQFTFNLPYRRYCASRSVTPESVSHWTQIPALPIPAFKEFDLTSLPAAERKFVFHSSGTTEQRPSRHFHSAESLWIYDASILAGFRAKLEELEKPWMIFLTPSPAEAPHSSLVYMFKTIKAAYGAVDSEFVGMADTSGAWRVDFDRTICILKDATRTGRPLFVFGTAFNFVHLLDFMDAHGLEVHLPANSWVLETGGYKGRSRVLPKADLRRLMTERLGVAQIISEYGMCELSSQAYALAGEGIFRFPRWARAQIVSPETGQEVSEGETGLIRVFDLANVYSVMAIQTEDLGVRRLSSVAERRRTEGAGFELIGRAALAEPRGCSLMSLA